MSPERRAVQNAAVQLKIDVFHQDQRFKAGNVFEAVYPGWIKVVRRVRFGEVNRIITAQAVHDERVRKVRCLWNFEFVIVVRGQIGIGNANTG